MALICLAGFNIMAQCSPVIDPLQWLSTALLAPLLAPHDQHYYITERLAKKICDRLYIKVGIAKFITILYIAKFLITNDRYNRYQISSKYQINGEMLVNNPS